MAKHYEKVAPRDTVTAKRFRLRRLDAMATRLAEAQTTLTACRTDVARCLVRYRRVMAAVEKERTRYERIASEESDEQLLGDAVLHDANTLAFAQALKEALVQQVERVEAYLDDVTTTRKAVRARRVRKVKRYR